MSAQDILTTQNPALAVFLVSGAILWCLWVGAMFFFGLVGAIHQIQRGIHLLFRERLEDEPRHSFPLKGTLK